MRNCSPNKNPLQTTNFKVSLDQTKFPNVSFYCMSVNLPDIANNAVQLSYRGQSVFQPSAKIEYSDLSLVALITEDLAVWEEIYNWMITNRSKPDGEHLFSDLTLSIRTGKNTASKQIFFRNVFPTNLGAIEMNSGGDTTPMTSSITFKYDYFEVED